MYKYYSQYGQDAFIDIVFLKHKKGGFFLDIGAHDGVTHSNTYYFEKLRGWKGICVEPNPTVFEQLKKNRQCNLVNACIHSENTTVRFTKISGYAEMLSGISTSYDERHLDRIQHEIAQRGGSVEEIDVKALTILQLFESNPAKQIDFLSLDIEGGELNVLELFPFNQIKPTLVLVENNYKDQKIANLLMKNGYQRVIKLGDEIYLNRSLSLAERARILLFRLLRKLGQIRKI